MESLETEGSVQRTVSSLLTHHSASCSSWRPSLIEQNTHTPVRVRSLSELNVIPWWSCRLFLALSGKSHTYTHTRHESGRWAYSNMWHKWWTCVWYHTHHSQAPPRALLMPLNGIPLQFPWICVPAVCFGVFCFPFSPVGVFRSVSLPFLSSVLGCFGVFRFPFSPV